MKRFFEILGVSAIILFSFYYTEKAALLVQSKSPIMTSIKNIEGEEKIEPVNAIIQGDTIIPGLCGLEVNSEKSFLKMQEFGAFNKYYLVYDEIKPNKSVEDYKDKMIIKGNKSKKAVSIIVENNENALNYLINNSKKINVITFENNYTKIDNIEFINGESTNIKFKNLESLLNQDKINKHLCIVNEKNKDICQKEGQYLIKPTFILTSSNYLEVKNNLESGAIIKISDTAKVEDLNQLINQIEYKDLNIIYLSELISEKNNT